MEELQIDNIVDFTTGVGVREYVAQRNGSLALEEPSYKLGEGGMLTSIVPTFGDVAILQQPYSNRILQQESATVTDPDLATAGLDLCSACNLKLSSWLTEQKKRIKGASSPFDSTGELSKAAAVNPDVIQEARATAGGLLSPEWSENPFVEDAASLTLSGRAGIPGLRRPDAMVMADENIEQLRQLFLSKPAPKQPQLTQAQLKSLGWLGGEQDTSVVPDHMIAKGGLIIPSDF